MSLKVEMSESWYDKGEPITRIEILKIIALNGFQSKTSLAKKLGSAITTIDTIVEKMKDEQRRLIQNHRKEHLKEGKAPHTMISLTEKGIRVLVMNHYQKNKINDKKQISEKPYLNLKEFINFCERYETDYIKQKKTKEFPKWKQPKLTGKNILDLYLKSTPQYKTALGKEREKYNSKIGKLLEKIKVSKQELNDFDDQIAVLLYETFK